MSTPEGPRADAQVTVVDEWQPIELPQTDGPVAAEFAEEEMPHDWVPVGYRDPEVWEDAEWVQIDPNATTPNEQAVAVLAAQGRLAVDPIEAAASWPGWGDDEVTSGLARRDDPATEI